MKNDPPNEIAYNHIDEIWSIGLADFSYYKTLNNKGYRYTFIIFDTIIKHLRTIPLKKTKH